MPVPDQSINQNVCDLVSVPITNTVKGENFPIDENTIVTRLADPYYDTNIKILMDLS